MTARCASTESTVAGRAARGVRAGAVDAVVAGADPRAVSVATADRANPNSPAPSRATVGLRIQSPSRTTPAKYTACPCWIRNIFVGSTPSPATGDNPYGRRGLRAVQTSVTLGAIGGNHDDLEVARARLAGASAGVWCHLVDG